MVTPDTAILIRAGHAVVAFHVRARSPATSSSSTSRTKRTSIKYKGKLAGKIVLFGAMRDVPPVDKPLFERYTDKELDDSPSFRSAPMPAAFRSGDAGSHAQPLWNACA